MREAFDRERSKLMPPRAKLTCEALCNIVLLLLGRLVSILLYSLPVAAIVMCQIRKQMLEE